LRQRLIILGAGYTARYVLPLAEHRYAHVMATSREPDKHLCHVAADRRVRFDLHDRTTWNQISPDNDLLWCFPAEPLELVQDFAKGLGLLSNRLVVLGSTSAYDMPTQATDYPPTWTDEFAPLNLGKSRVQGEEWLRKNHGATVLRVAGIYGPGRSPIDWIRKGRVGPSRKYVNLIHVEDLSAICLTALERGLPGEAYNVSDGTPRTWTEICRRAQDRWGIQSAARSDEDVPSGKRIANGKLLAMLQSGRQHLRYPDLWRALDQLVAPTG
jgi:hypothetical protein